MKTKNPCKCGKALTVREIQCGGTTYSLHCAPCGVKIGEFPSEAAAIAWWDNTPVAPTCAKCAGELIQVPFKCLGFELEIRLCPTCKEITEKDPAGREPFDKKCPFCGSVEIEPWSDDTGEVFFMKCLSCDMEGPTSGDAEKARELWNNRPGEDAIREAFRELFWSTILPGSKLSEAQKKAAIALDGWENSVPL